MREVGVEEFSLLNFKNLFLAPFFEEFIYRVVIINIFLEANILSVNKCVLILPLFFAIGKIINDNSYSPWALAVSRPQFAS